MTLRAVRLLLNEASLAYKQHHKCQSSQSCVRQPISMLDLRGDRHAVYSSEERQVASACGWTLALRHNGSGTLDCASATTQTARTLRKADAGLMQVYTRSDSHDASVTLRSNHRWSTDVATVLVDCHNNVGVPRRQAATHRKAVRAPPQSNGVTIRLSHMIARPARLCQSIPICSAIVQATDQISFASTLHCTKLTNWYRTPPSRTAPTSVSAVVCRSCSPCHCAVCAVCAIYSLLSLHHTEHLRRVGNQRVWIAPPQI